MSERFTPVEVTKVEQLEHALQSERFVRETRDNMGGDDSRFAWKNPDGDPSNPEEPLYHEVVFDKAMLRGLKKIKQALHDDVVYDMRKNFKDNRFVRRIQPEKKAIVDGLLDAYQREDGIR